MRYSIRKLLLLSSFALLVAVFLSINPLTAHPSKAASLVGGKEIVISLSRQWLYVYENGALVYNTPATTGQPGLNTPTGTYRVFARLSPTTFTSPWPKG